MKYKYDGEEFRNSENFKNIELFYKNNQLFKNFKSLFEKLHKFAPIKNIIKNRVLITVLVQLLFLFLLR